MSAPKLAKKSVLDGVPIDDQAFPLNKSKIKEEELCIVGECATCGAPYYGKSRIKASETPVVKASCKCSVIEVDG